MDLNAKAFCYFDGELFDTALHIRKQVFVDELGFEHNHEFDGEDPFCIHYLVYYGEEPVGTCRWRKTDEGILLERVAVQKQYRSLSVGEKLIKRVLVDIIPLNHRILVYSRDEYVNFFKKFGFRLTGDSTSINSYTYYRMEYSTKI